MENAHEGLGAILRRNQLAVFLADVYAADLAWDHMPSSHGYNTDSFFSECQPAQDGCKLFQKSMVLPRCPRGDCVCLWQGVSRYLLSVKEEEEDDEGSDKKKKTEQGKSMEMNCTVLGVKNDRLVTQEYSGCMGDAMRRYFVHSNKTLASHLLPSTTSTTTSPIMTTTTAPTTTTKGEYDVIHYRMGDLRKKPGTKSPSEIELFYLLEAMCKLSTRRIYILTEGNPGIPDVSCFDRLFMASDTSLHDAFSIMRYARIVSVGSSSFSIVLAEVAQPEEVVTLHRTLALYEWMDAERWTVVMERGEFFHFDSKVGMIATLLTGRDPRARTYRREGWFNATSFKMKKIPDTRQYNESEFWIPIGNGEK